jgi:spore coat protein A
LRLNIFSGLAGFYFIRDEFEEELNLLRGRYEIPC